MANSSFSGSGGTLGAAGEMNEYSFNEFISFKAIRDLQVFQEICLTNSVPFDYSFNDFHQTNEFV